MVWGEEYSIRAAVDGRGAVGEVAVRRGRGSRPLQRVGVPGIGARPAPEEHRTEEVQHNQRLRCHQRERRVGHEAVQRHELGVHGRLRVIGDAARHPRQPEDVHREEDEVERDERQNEVAACRASRSSVGRTSWGTSSRSPRTAPIDAAAEQHVVDVGDDEIGGVDVTSTAVEAMKMPDRPADDEQRHECRPRLAARRGEVESSAPHRAQPVERLDAPRGRR